MMLRRALLGTVFLACVLPFSQGCEKAVEKIKIDLFPSGKPGQAS